MHSPTALILLLAMTFPVGVLRAQTGTGEAALNQSPAKLPPLPPGVTELGWKDFFVTPVGRDGLQLTPKIKSLDGKRVRLLGYMVRREEPSQGVLILTPLPASIEEHESGFADLPPQAVRVLLPHAANEEIPFTPRPLLLTGTLSVGRREESGEASGGVVSWFRLKLDKPEPTAPDKGEKPTIQTPDSKPER